MLGLDSQRKTSSNPYDIDQLRNSVNARSLSVSNAVYRSSTMSNDPNLILDRTLWRNLIHVSDPTYWDKAWLLLSSRLFIFC